MMVAEGILTARGGLVSHAAVVARGWGTPAVVGAEAVKITGKSFTVGGVTVNEGDSISHRRLDRRGRARRRWTLADAEPPAEFDVILGWADAVRTKGKRARRARQRRHRRGRRQRPPARRRGHRPVPHRAHVPRPRPPAGRAPDDPRPTPSEEETEALDELRKVQQDDFTEILEAMDGLPVTVRLLDPPLHEFLPSVEELRIKQATERPRRRGGGSCWRPPRAGPSTTRCSAPAACASASSSPGSTRCRCGRCSTPPPTCASRARTRSSRS